MRLVLTLGATLLAGGLALNADRDNAQAASLPSIASLNVAPSVVEPAGWRRRYWRRYGVWPPEGPPPAVVEEDVIADPGGDAVVVVPVRPLSCGEFHYWNGVACVDARYNDPYLGPK